MPRYAKRHYVEIAELLQAARLGSPVGTARCMQDVVTRFADMFERDNSKFDRDRFVLACDDGLPTRPPR
jgi:hypothetical protein